jgi:opacity protein-like surface antigen
MKILRNSFLALLGTAMIGVSYAGPVMTPSVGPAPAPVGGPYVSIAGGALWLDDASAHNVDLDFDTGFSILAALGYGFGNGLAVEIESGYQEVNDAEVSAFGLHADVDGEFRQVPILANVVYTIPVSDAVGIYIGAGAGIIWSDAEIDSVGGLRNLDFDAEDEWNFAAQAKAGLSFNISDNASVNIGYRFIYGKDAVGGLDDSIGHVLEGGFTLRF